MAKLADALDLGSSAARHVGSSPSIRTIHTHSFTASNNPPLLKKKILNFS